MNQSDKSFIMSALNNLKEEIISELKGKKKANVKSEKQYRLRKDIMGIHKVKKSDVI